MVLSLSLWPSNVYSYLSIYPLLCLLLHQGDSLKEQKSRDCICYNILLYYLFNNWPQRKKVSIANFCFLCFDPRISFRKKSQNLGPKHSQTYLVFYYCRNLHLTFLSHSSQTLGFHRLHFKHSWIATQFLHNEEVRLALVFALAQF